MLTLVITHREPGVYIDRYLCADCVEKGKPYYALHGGGPTGISGFGACEKCGAFQAKEDTK